MSSGAKLPKAVLSRKPASLVVHHVRRESLPFVLGALAESCHEQLRGSMVVWNVSLTRGLRYSARSSRIDIRWAPKKESGIAVMRALLA
jgi:hypothetical protein